MTALSLTTLIAALNTLGTAWWSSVRQDLPLTTAFVALVWLACRLAKRHVPQSAQSWLWWLTCLKVVFCLVCIPLVPVAILPQATPYTFARHAKGKADADPALPPFVATESAPAAAPTAPPPAPVLTLAGSVFAVWLAGICLAFGILVRQAIALRRICKSARDVSDSDAAIQMRRLSVRLGLIAPPRLAVSDRISAPLVCGGLRPVVLLPTHTLQAWDETEMILAHELAHLRRGDLWLSWVPWAATAVTFWLPWVTHPLVRGWERAREAACDRTAVQITGAHPDRYCRVLLEVVGRDAHARQGWRAALGATEAFHTIHGRIEALRHEQGNRGVVWGASCLLPLVALIFLRPVTNVNATTNGSLSPPRPLPPVADVPHVPAWEIQIGENTTKQYLLTGAGLGQAAPASGYGLLVVLPGGNGDRDFSPFVRRLAQRALGREWAVAQLIAPTWDAQQKSEVVWPIRTNPWPGMKFATEDFIRDTIQDAGRRLPLDSRRILVLGWASGGRAATAAVLAPDVPVRGGYVAMSQWRGWEMPDHAATDRRCFVLHPRDVPFVPLASAASAVSRLQASGTQAELVPYEGGYGWHGDVYAQIRQGMAYLDKP